MEKEENYEPKAPRIEDKNSVDSRRWAREFIRREGVVIPDPEYKASKQFFAEKPGKMGTFMIIVLVFGGVYIGTALASWARILLGLK